MTEIPDVEKFEHLIQKFKPTSKLLRIWPLRGGVSALVTALEIEQSDGLTKKMVARQHGEIDRQHNPHIAADEFRLLGILQSAGVAAPKPYYLDQSGEIFSIPCLIIEYIEGQTEFTPVNLPDFLHQMALQLSRIHTIDDATADLSFLPQQAQLYTDKLSTRLARLDDLLDEGRIRDTLERIWPLPAVHPSTLLHGDFWPGNLLWKEGQLVAVIDWEDAHVGDPLEDVANARLEILWAFGIDAMNEFTHQYQSPATIDFNNLPYWDLCAALRPASRLSDWGLDTATEKSMRERHKWFVEAAFEKLTH